METLTREKSYIRMTYSSLSGSLEYKQKVKKFERIDQILDQSGIEENLKDLMVELKTKEANQSLTPKEKVKIRIKTSQCLRINIAKALYNSPIRVFSERLSDSAMLQWFCCLDGPDTKKMPGKSTLYTISQFIPIEAVQHLIRQILSSFSTENKSVAPIDLDSLYVDSTCAKLNIHHPVDWVFLKDAVRSLIRSIKTIRKHGIKYRMPSPNSFIERANQLSIAMSNTKSSRTQDAKAKRKEILRELKKLLRIVEAHGYRYSEMLMKSLSKTDLSKVQAQNISERMIKLLDQVDDIIWQAHERVIGERTVKNKDKILSLYQRHAQVYKRGKAGADVEFGLQLFIAETEQGLIANYQLRDQAPQHDAKFIKPCLAELEKVNIKPKNITGDRGCSSKQLENYLLKNNINSFIFPKGADDFGIKQKEGFREATKRRSGIEARIGILKQKFIGKALSAKEYKNQDLEIAWSVVAHNFELLAGMTPVVIPDSKQAA